MTFNKYRLIRNTTYEFITNKSVCDGIEYPQDAVHTIDLNWEVNYVIVFLI